MWLTALVMTACGRTEVYGPPSGVPSLSPASPGAGPDSGSGPPGDAGHPHGDGGTRPVVPGAAPAVLGGYGSLFGPVYADSIAAGFGGGFVVTSVEWYPSSELFEIGAASWLKDVGAECFAATCDPELQGRAVPDVSDDVYVGASFAHGYFAQPSIAPSGNNHAGVLTLLGDAGQQLWIQRLGEDPDEVFVDDLAPFRDGVTDEPYPFSYFIEVP